jgi:hypothetical protein
MRCCERDLAKWLAALIICTKCSLVQGSVLAFPDKLKKGWGCCLCAKQALVDRFNCLVIFSSTSSWKLIFFMCRWKAGLFRRGFRGCGGLSSSRLSRRPSRYSKILEYCSRVADPHKFRLILIPYIFFIITVHFLIHGSGSGCTNFTSILNTGNFYKN